MLDENVIQKALPYLMVAGGGGQVAVGVEVAKMQAAAPAPVATSSWAALIFIVPGVMFAAGGILQIILNFVTKQKRIEIETRLRRLEMGLPCEDAACPIQRIATAKTAPVRVFGGTTSAKPADDTVDLK
jgi:hypothetical protein